MSTTKPIKAKITTATPTTKKIPNSVASKVSVAPLTETTNVHSAHLNTKKTSSVSSLAPTKNSTIASSISTPRSTSVSTTKTSSRIVSNNSKPDSVIKQSVAIPRTQQQPTVSLPIQSSSTPRSFSELVKSEESLQQQVYQLQQALKDSNIALRDSQKEVETLKAELKNTQDHLTKTHRNWEAKTDFLLSQQSEKYQDLNDRYLDVLTRARACEAKLEELFIDPLTLMPFDMTDSQQEALTVERSGHRTLLELIEESNYQHNASEISSQKELRNVLEMAANQLSSTSSIEDVLCQVRENTEKETIEQEMAKIESNLTDIFVRSLGKSEIEYESDSLDQSVVNWSTSTFESVSERNEVSSYQNGLYDNITEFDQALSGVSPASDPMQQLDYQNFDAGRLQMPTSSVSYSSVDSESSFFEEENDEFEDSCEESDLEAPESLSAGDEDPAHDDGNL